ncbi:MAG: HD domain-containing protein [Candidatus Aenigmatarchaeota archaeon]|nr:HD domain-containing protein [Nanoarchaeota archaeon]
MIPINEIEELAVKTTSDVNSLTHGFPHLKRTAVGARWFSEVLGYDQQDQDLAYAAGIIHDLHRPNTEKTDHTESSVQEAGDLLSKINLSGDIKSRILEMIEEHRDASEVDLKNKVVFLSDKLFEQMGAYVVFRRWVWISGECVDYKGVPFVEGYIKQSGYRMSKFNVQTFPPAFQKLAEYQFNWAMDFYEALKQGKEWSLELGDFVTENWRNYTILDDVIRHFNPESDEGQKYKQEALDYIDGKKFDYFKGLVG